QPGITADKLLTPGNEWHDDYFRLLDGAAKGLQELRDNNVVVLWKPVHGRDSNSAFFWSMDVMSQPDYVRIWRHMVDYFSNTWGLNNILYMQDFYYAGRWGDIRGLYVGDDLVDLVGYDSMASPQELSASEYANLLSFGKPAGTSQTFPYAPDNYT